MEQPAQPDWAERVGEAGDCMPYTPRLAGRAQVQVDYMGRMQSNTLGCGLELTAPALRPLVDGHIQIVPDLHFHKKKGAA